jgi:hypothetical protein
LRERNSKGICHSGMSALGRACTYQQIDFTAQEGSCFLKRKKKDERRIMSRILVLKIHDCSAYVCWVRVVEDLILPPCI